MSRTRFELSALGAALVGAAMFAGGPAAAQTSSESDIIITAASREQTQSFVSQVAIAPTSADQLGRWDEAVCVGVAGLPARQGQFIADRIAQRAFALGLEPGAPGCSPNISIVVGPNGNEVAQRMVNEEPSLFAIRYETGIRTLGQEALTAFVNSDRPVRWWHVTREVGADGERLSSENASMGASGFSAQTVRSNGTRLSNTTRQDFARVVIIVDGGSAGQVQMAGLADYIAMVALAQVNPDANTSAYPTIMNLFAGGATAPSQLTQWDLAYLDALYSTSREAASTTAQEADIARRMVGQRS
jgi:hypothetical protein